MPASAHFSVPVGHTGLPLESRVADLRIQLGDLPPESLAVRAGASFLNLGPGRGEIHLSLLGRPVLATYPDFRALTSSGESLPVFKQALLFYYLLATDGIPPSGEWIAFSELPEGRVYASAFEGYTGTALANRFLLDIESFRVACHASGGLSSPLGDAGFHFEALPRLPLAVAYHLGDDEFPSTCKILFDANASHHLPTEACAILGNMLAQQILRAASSGA